MTWNTDGKLSECHPHALKVGFLGYTGAAEFDETLPHLEAACAYFAEAQPEARKLIHNVSKALNQHGPCGRQFL